MAWLGIIVGTILGLICVFVAPAVYGLPVWAAIMLYPLVGTFGAVLTILILLQLRPGPAQPCSPGDCASHHRPIRPNRSPLGGYPLAQEMICPARSAPDWRLCSLPRMKRTIVGIPRIR